MTPATINNPRLDRAIRVMNITAIVAMVIAIGSIFLFAPVEVTMGNVQRLFYFHVGSAWVGAMVFGVALVCGVLYLRRARRVYDTVALAAVEVGGAQDQITECGRGGQARGDAGGCRQALRGDAVGQHEADEHHRQCRDERGQHG